MFLLFVRLLRRQNGLLVPESFAQGVFLSFRLSKEIKYYSFIDSQTGKSWIAFNMFSCDQCDYEATDNLKLISHRQLLHKVKKYPCNLCDYQATKRGNLLSHKQSIHEQKKYPCDSCDYQATKKGHLVRHEH